LSTPERRIATGTSGEAHARRYLEARGYRFIAKNWHCPDGELDLVMIDGHELVFIEVKTRRGEYSGRAAESVSTSKARKLLASGEWFIDAHPQYQDMIWRCDLVAITINPRSGIASVQHEINAIVEDH
jgi:putative endonuclease